MMETCRMGSGTSQVLACLSPRGVIWLVHSFCVGLTARLPGAYGPRTLSVTSLTFILLLGRGKGK